MFLWLLSLLRQLADQFGLFGFKSVFVSFAFNFFYRLRHRGKPITPFFGDEVKVTLFNVVKNLNFI